MAKPTPSQSPRKDFTPTMDSVVDTHGQPDLDSNTGKMTPSSLSQLENLPDELLELTISFIADENDGDHFKNLPNIQKALHSLCVTSKSLHRITLPHLYRIYMHTHATKLNDFDIDEVDSKNDQHLQNFVKSVSETPWLAKCIRELHLTRYGPRRIVQELTSGEHFNTLQIPMPSLLGPKNHARFLKKLRKGDPNAASAALLLVASHLERLMISLDEHSCFPHDIEEGRPIPHPPKDYRWSEEIFNSVPSQDTAQRDVLAHLKSVHIRSPFMFRYMSNLGVTYGIFSRTVHSVFSLPTLRVLNITAESCSFGSFHQNEISPITHFSLRASDMDCRSVAEMISHFESLEVLFIRWNELNRAGPYARPQFPGDIFLSLRLQRDSLRSLTLNSVAVSLYSTTVAQLPALAGFKNLEYLAVDEDYVLWQALIGEEQNSEQQRSLLWPPQLKHLTHFSRDGSSFHLETLACIIRCHPPSSLETFTSMVLREDYISVEDFDSLKPYTSNIFEADISLDEMDQCQIRIATTKVVSLVERMRDGPVVNEDSLDFPQFLDDPKIGGLSTSARRLFQNLGLITEIQGLFSGFLEPYHNIEVEEDEEEDGDDE